MKDHAINIDINSIKLNWRNITERAYIRKIEERLVVGMRQLPHKWDEYQG